ncbi:phosphatidylinositol-3,5-bisphosphate 3-phosphatase MTMR8 isoform X16 [Macaca fascicularis]|uniref:phosphatidylinositol-3,5-bisphosphate 3-phosphatase MTMR8 isoform X16 n=1 Tax=Macaca fascicularis TaxID=9541 RepID=UPI003D15B579
MDHITVPKVENVKLVDRYVSKKPANGILYLTATHLIYVEASGAARKETWIALHHIATVEKLPITSLGCPLTLRCKNFRVAHFVLDSDLVCHEVYISLLKLSQPALPEDLYAFSYNPKSSKEMRESGWKLIEAISDFGRMGIPNRYWTITDANRNYEICSTYPPEIVVPKSVTLGTVVGSSKFRSKERVPVLSYLYKENNAAICRCSQPLSGFYTRCVDDELLLEAISQANPGSQFMYVVDTRPKLNAMANRAAGKGYENEDNYANIRFRFMGIENIHVMRNSLQKLLEESMRKHILCGLSWFRGNQTSGTLSIKASLCMGYSILVLCPTTLKTHSAGLAADRTRLKQSFKLSSQVAGTTSMCCFLNFFVEVGFLCVVQAGLELLASNNSPALASQGAGIIRVSHCIWPHLLASLILYSLVLLFLL